jgi:hypothetical protein
MKTQLIALFDMDGTLCDFEKSLTESMRKIQSPNEKPFVATHPKKYPDHIQNRKNLILSSVEWWANIPQLKLGFDIWNFVGLLKMRRMILTQGPKRNANAWTGKKMWIDKNIGCDTDITITRNKGLVYGKLLVDDWPEYIIDWLEWRPRGLVIMPANNNNKNFKHSQVIRYDGNNFNEVITAIREIKTSNQE